MSNQFDKQFEMESKITEMQSLIETLEQLDEDTKLFCETEREAGEMPQDAYDSMAPIILKRFKRKTELNSALLGYVLPELKSLMQQMEKENQR